MKASWTLALELYNDYGDYKGYIVKATKETFWTNQDYYIAKYGPSKYVYYTTYELCSPDRKAHANVVCSEKEAKALWQEFLDKTDLIVKHKHEEPELKAPESTVIGRFDF